MSNINQLSNEQLLLARIFKTQPQKAIFTALDRRSVTKADKAARKAA